jgi:hypothetical protein
MKSGFLEAEKHERFQAFLENPKASTHFKKNISVTEFFKKAREHSRIKEKQEIIRQEEREREKSAKRKRQERISSEKAAYELKKVKRDKEMGLSRKVGGMKASYDADVSSIVTSDDEDHLDLTDSEREANSDKLDGDDE